MRSTALECVTPQRVWVLTNIHLIFQFYKWKRDENHKCSEAVIYLEFALVVVILTVSFQNAKIILEQHQMSPGY